MLRTILSRLAQKYVRLVHVRGASPEHGRAPGRDGIWNPQPLNPQHVREGSPVARVCEFGETSDRGMSFGAWDCTAGRFKWVYYVDEVITIIEGEAFVEINGVEEHLTAGSMFYFPFGTVAHWHVPEYIRKHFILRHPSQIAARLI